MFLLCQCEVVFLVVVSATASVSIGDRDAGGTSFLDFNFSQTIREREGGNGGDKLKKK